MSNERHASGIEMYLNDVGDCRKLSHTEEIALATRIACGGSDGTIARNALVRENLPLVVNIARGYAGKGVALNDLIEEGNFGLIKAAEFFDPRTYGTRFSTYATIWIKKYLHRAIKNHRTNVRVPVYMHDLMAKWKKAASILRSECGHEPATEEIARRVGIPAREHASVRNICRTLGRGEQQMGDAVFSLPEENDEDTHEEIAGLIARVRMLLPTLDVSDQKLLAMRFGLNGFDHPYKLREIGEVLGITKEGVRKRERKCLQDLRKALE